MPAAHRPPPPAHRKPACRLPLIQVAGIHDVAEARLLMRCGVRWLGFPLRLAVHREDLTRAEAARTVAALPARAVPVLITYLAQADALLALARRMGARAVQLHGPVPLQEAVALRRRAPDLFLVKSLIVDGDNRRELLATAALFASCVDAFISDSRDPASGACGATGRVHDWRVSRALASAVPRPLILAGGLGPGNVRDAILAVRPAGVDCHTGVEGPDGRKDPDRVRAFVAAARAGFAALRTIA
jgi:phosphoribosylanthranilate isomerase